MTQSEKISAAEREERRKSVVFAVGSNRFEGFITPPECMAIFERYIEGEIDIEELVIEVKQLAGEATD